MSGKLTILVTGGSGMLGKAVTEVAQARGHDVYTPDHRNFNIATDSQRYEDKLDNLGRQMDRVINCAGCIPLKQYSSTLMIAVNSIGPWKLAELYGDTHVIHVSTDCVFSGANVKPNSIFDNPDPVDLYGRSKLIGEVIKDNVSILRTSFIGFEHGLARWLLDQKRGSVVEGWANHWWTGAYVKPVARAIVQYAEKEYPEARINHLSMRAPICKADVLEKMVDTFDLALGVERVRTPQGRNRSLQPTIALPPIEEWITEMAEDYKRLVVA